MAAEQQSCLATALASATRGWRVLPVKHSGKNPLTAHGVKDASLNEATIRDLWAKWPSANVGIATGSTSGLVVMDIDGERGGKSLHALENELGPLPVTRRARTGDGLPPEAGRRAATRAGAKAELRAMAENYLYWLLGGKG